MYVLKNVPQWQYRLCAKFHILLSEQHQKGELRYSACVTRHHMVMATLCCTDIERRINVSFFSMVGDNRSQRYAQKFLDFYGNS